MVRLSLDDFEWVERGFDSHVLIHKKYEMHIAYVGNFNGWRVQVWKETKQDGPITGETLDVDAAKAIAALYANKHMEEYTNVFNRKRNNFRKRAPAYRPEKVPRGVFKVG